MVPFSGPAPVRFSGPINGVFGSFVSVAGPVFRTNSVPFSGPAICFWALRWPSLLALMSTDRRADFGDSPRPLRIVMLPPFVGRVGLDVGEPEAVRLCLVADASRSTVEFDKA